MQALTGWFLQGVLCPAGNTLYMHGGCSNFVLGELYSLDLTSWEWRELGPMGHHPPTLQVLCLPLCAGCK